MNKWRCARCWSPHDSPPSFVLGRGWCERCDSYEYIEETPKEEDE